MTEHELDTRFSEVQLLFTDTWTREPLHGLAQEIAEARELKDTAKEAPALRALRDYIRTKCALIREGLDKFLNEVPNTERAGVLLMELLTGRPALPGTELSTGALASALESAVLAHVYQPWEEKRDGYQQRLTTDGPAAAYAWEQEVRKWEALRRSVVAREIEVEAVHLGKHIKEAGEQWMKRPTTGNTFADCFSADEWTKLEHAMQDAGISPRKGKGKNDVVAAVHAALLHCGKHLPSGGHWLELLRNTYPSVEWSDKCVPEERPRYRTKSYERAYQATLDRLL